jgi:hypothetical protein
MFVSVSLVCFPCDSREYGILDLGIRRHVPTNIVVKVHDTRSLLENRRIAHARLARRVDHLLRGGLSYEGVRAELARRRGSRTRQRSRKRHANSHANTYAEQAAEQSEHAAEHAEQAAEQTEHVEHKKL